MSWTNHPLRQLSAAHTSYRPIHNEENADPNWRRSTVTVDDATEPEYETTFKGSSSKVVTRSYELGAYEPLEYGGPSLVSQDTEAGPVGSIEGRRKTWLHKYFSGWKVGVSAAALAAVTVCVVNIIMTVAAAAYRRPDDGIATLFRGSCARVQTLSFWGHMAINLLSTALLSGSNYTMQILASPTREEIDKAHSKFRWLNIGIPSVRNLTAISRTRAWMWWCLAFSSVPLHLLYNTAVFQSIAANDYLALMVTEDFVSRADYAYKYNDTVMQEEIALSPLDLSRTLEALHTKAHTNALTNMTLSDCLTNYTGVFVSKYSNVLLVVDSQSANGSGPSFDVDPFLSVFYEAAVSLEIVTLNNTNTLDTFPQWYNPPEICVNESTTTDCSQVIKDHTVCPGIYAGGRSWANTSTATTNFTASYCLVEETSEKCELDFSVSIMCVVIVINAIKAAVMLVTVLKLTARPMVTVGDVVADFLDKPDPTTANLCLISKKDIHQGKWVLENPTPEDIWRGGRPDLAEEAWGLKKEPQEWHPEQHQWFRGASFDRWVGSNALCFITIVAGVALLVEGIRTLDEKGHATDIKSLFTMGFGFVSLDSTVNISAHSLTATVLIANMPQTIISYLYLMYNALFSCVLGEDEWNRFAHHRKPLRVTSPSGKQRSTYFLSVPYRYGLPLMVFSGALHWCVSQSLFLVRISAYSFADPDQKTDGGAGQVGYSCIGIIFSISLGSLAVMAGLLNGFRRYKPGMPLAGSCSAVISAACHRMKDDPDASVKPVQWGAVDEGPDTPLNTVGHCTFSSRRVCTPYEGREYAGR